ncbi:MAG: hypothetical protein WDO18_02165 [Acidobacteriota bacterium]
MIARRALLLIPLGAFAQPRRPRLEIRWTNDRPGEALTFPRAYSACTDRRQAEWALEHGRFPHARIACPSLWDFFDRANGAAADIVITTIHSANGDDSPKERSVHVPLAISCPVNSHLANLGTSSARTSTCFQHCWVSPASRSPPAYKAATFRRSSLAKGATANSPRRSSWRATSALAANGEP